MNKKLIIPKIANSTDLRYRWKSLVEELEEEKIPILVLDSSTPRALIFPFEEGKEWLKGVRQTAKTSDPFVNLRKKYGYPFSGIDFTKEIRKMRDKRWNLSF